MTDYDTLKSNADQIWILLSGFLVFWMHAGFSMLEAGSVRKRNTNNILFKNLGTICIGAIAYFLFGYSFAYGINSNRNEFIGSNSGYYGIRHVRNDEKHSWFFQFAFAATASTILSGAIAGRAKLEAYFIMCAFITSFMYPVVSHWVWGTEGWLSAFDKYEWRFGYDQNKKTCGMIDYAGSGVVHLVGGCAALMGTIIVGSRNGRWNGDGSAFLPHNYPFAAMGVLILWFGWYGFNCGSTLAFDGPIASKVAVTTTLSPAAACIVGILVHRLVINREDKKLNLPNALNCVLAGLVSITAGCSVVEDFNAIFIGAIGALVYMGASQAMMFFHLDDPVDAVAVHGACGIWGCLAVGIFAKGSEIQNAYDCPEAEGNLSGFQFGVQLAGVLAIIAWSCSMSAVALLAIKYTIGVTVSEEEQEVGLDLTEHGEKAYNDGAEIESKELKQISEAQP